VNVKAFFVAALQSALDLGIATPDDVLKHATPDILANHLPRPLWARLFTACLGAPRVDAQLVIETIGVPNLCEHVPANLIWICLAEVGARALGRKVDDAVPVMLTQQKSPGSKPLATPPPPEVITKPSNPPLAPLPKLAGAPQASVDIDLDSETPSDRPAASGRATRVPTQQRFRQAQTGSGIGRLATPPAAPPASSSRRPQAAAPLPKLTARRGETEVEEAEAETSVGSKDEWRNTIAVDDDQLVDWQASEETLTVADDISDSRKR
jgi:hypothetical protein